MLGNKKRRDSPLPTRGKLHLVKTQVTHKPVSHRRKPRRAAASTMASIPSSVAKPCNNPKAEIEKLREVEVCRDDLEHEEPCAESGLGPLQLIVDNFNRMRCKEPLTSSPQYNVQGSPNNRDDQFEGPRIKNYPVTSTPLSSSPKEFDISLSNISVESRDSEDAPIINVMNEIGEGIVPISWNLPKNVNQNHENAQEKYTASDMLKSTQLVEQCAKHDTGNVKSVFRNLMNAFNKTDAEYTVHVQRSLSMAQVTDCNHNFITRSNIKSTVVAHCVQSLKQKNVEIQKEIEMIDEGDSFNDNAEDNRPVHNLPIADSGIHVQFHENDHCCKLNSYCPLLSRHKVLPYGLDESDSTKDESKSVDTGSESSFKVLPYNLDESDSTKDELKSDDSGSESGCGKSLSLPAETKSPQQEVAVIKETEEKINLSKPCQSTNTKASILPDVRDYLSKHIPDCVAMQSEVSATRHPVEAEVHGVAANEVEVHGVAANETEAHFVAANKAEAHSVAANDITNSHISNTSSKQKKTDKEKTSRKLKNKRTRYGLPGMKRKSSHNVQMHKSEEVADDILEESMFCERKKYKHVAREFPEPQDDIPQDILELIP